MGKPRLRSEFHGIDRQGHRSYHFHYHGDEELIFTPNAEDVIFMSDNISKNRENSIFAQFINVKQSGEETLLTLSLKQIKDRIKQYQRTGKDTSALVSAKQACQKEFPTHLPRRCFA